MKRHSDKIGGIMCLIKKINIKIVLTINIIF
jgi:hypothetical protein